MLTVRDLAVSIKAADILHGVDLEAVPHGLTGLMGRNGAGKTTLLRSVMGLLPIRGGTIVVGGDDVTGVPPYRRPRLGIGYMPEDRRLVPELSVEENILIPAWAAGRRETGDRLRWIYGVMPEVERFSERKAFQLSGGQQKLVALARALIIGDKLLLLDEPFEGVAPALARRLVEVLADLKGEGLSILLSESDSTHSFDLLDALYVIERGRVTPKALEGVA